MPIVLSWLRLDLRRRWRSLAVLALIVAAASATVMSAVAGARRGASAMTRLQVATLPATTVMLANEPGFDWDRIRSLPQVETLTTFLNRYSFFVDGISHDIGVAGAAQEISQRGAFAPADDQVMRSIEKPVVHEGRVFDPSRDDEAVVSPKFADRFGRGVGDTLSLTLPTPAELAQGLDGTGPELTGPRLTLHIVGIVSAPWFADSADSPGNVVLSPGVVGRHPQNTLANSTQTNPAQVDALVRLRDGAAALPAFRAAVQRATGRADIDIWDLPEQRRHTQRQLTFEARCLLAFGAAAFVASLFLVGQAIVRHAAATAAELATMRALGMAPRQVAAAASAAPLVAGLVGGVAGIVLTALVSRWFPIGTARLIEPHPGRSLDWVVAAPGLSLVLLLVALASAGAASMALRAARGADPGRPSTIAAAATRAGLPVPVLIGTRFALEAGRGARAVPVRPALTGAVVGVLGIVAAFTFSAGVADASDHPERFGQTFGIGGFIGVGGHDFFPSEVATSTLVNSADVAAVGDVRNGVATAQDGNHSVSLFTVAPGPKQLDVVVASGRRPAAAGEMMLAERTMRALGIGVGSRVELTGRKTERGAEPAARVYTVTGTGLVPQGPHNSYSDGGWVTPEGFDALFEGFTYHFVLAELRDGVVPDRVTGPLARRINERLGAPAGEGFTLDVPASPVELLELRQVRALPLVLGLFLALLAVGAIGHVLATAVRRRASDIAVLRALGMTRTQSRWVTVSQASVLALAGLLIGLPTGLALGRVVWRAVADYLPLQYVAPSAGLAMLLAVPAALLVVNVLAALPSRRAARLRIADVLRAE